MIAHVATSQKRRRKGFPGLHSLTCDKTLLLEERNYDSSLKMGDLLGLWNLKLCWHKKKKHANDTSSCKLFSDLVAMIHFLHQIGKDLALQLSCAARLPMRIIVADAVAA
jgi:hypothetical protein